ncbi:hypothetical protein GCM10017556_36140 [Micromonospora sagamiensis]|nr:hypothetical protein GCM10017556_36140 [Micromonospora sagamiensis]
MVKRAGYPAVTVTDAGAAVSAKSSTATPGCTDRPTTAGAERADEGATTGTTMVSRTVTTTTKRRAIRPT